MYANKFLSMHNIQTWYDCISIVDFLFLTSSNWNKNKFKILILPLELIHNKVDSSYLYSYIQN